MIVCDICHAAVFETHMDRHYTWHNSASIVTDTLLRRGRDNHDSIIVNTENIQTNADNIVANSASIVVNTDDIVVNTEDIVVNTDDIDLVAKKVVDLESVVISGNQAD